MRSKIWLFLSNVFAFISYFFIAISRRLCPHDPIKKVVRGFQVFECKHCKIAVRLQK